MGIHQYDKKDCDELFLYNLKLKIINYLFCVEFYSFLSENIHNTIFCNISVIIESKFKKRKRENC